MRPAADVGRMGPLPACSLQSRLPELGPARDPAKDEGGARTAGINGPAELAAITCSAVLCQGIRDTGRPLTCGVSIEWQGIGWLRALVCQLM